MRARTLVQRRDQPYWLWWAAVLGLALGLLVLITMTACRRGVPVIDTSPPPPEVHGTISGTVRGPEGATAIEGRMVEAVNLETDERQRVATSNTGGFTFKVKPGKYRLELTLLKGETIVKAPGVRHVNPSDIDAGADFIVSQGRDGVTGRFSRPRAPALRLDPGLGSPTA